MIEIAVLGQPYWGGRIAASLDAPEAGMRSFFVPTSQYARLLARPARADRVILMRAGYRAGGTTPRARAFDAYWALLRKSRRRAQICHYWLGTDVLNTLDEARAGTLRRGVVGSIRDDIHLTDAPWLSAELATVGIEAVTAHVPVHHRAPVEPGPLPEKFGVLTYLPNLMFEFFGGPAILEAARRLPEVDFEIVGGTAPPGSPHPPNATWHGWVSDLPRYYANAVAVLRLPRHDGLGETVIEGLLNARHVLYTYDMPHVRKLISQSADELVAALVAMRDCHAAGNLGPNLAGRDYALAEFDYDKLAAHLSSILRNRA